MRKGYIYSETIVGGGETVYGFTSHPEKAHYWETRDEAEADCKKMNERGVEIPKGSGRTYRNFEIEERGPKEFLICCAAKFTESA